MARTALALGAVLMALGSIPPSYAQPSRSDLQHAKDKVANLENKMEILVEKYNQTREELAKTRDILQELREERERARARAADAQTKLNDAAAEAYKEGGSGLVRLLTAASFADLTNRVEFLDIVATIQEDTATRADVAGEQARQASVALAKAEAKQESLLKDLASQKSRVQKELSNGKAEIADIEDALAAQIVPKSSGTVITGPLPPINGSGAQAAIAAAKSVLGVRYKYAGDSPDEGFDCSGLTMWAWAHGGVSLPHSSQQQYSTLPHVPRDQLQPGDLVFFFNPISHVELYLGGGRMIGASSSQGKVVERAVYWQYYSGGARPG